MQAGSAELSLLALSLQWTLEAHLPASASPSILSFPALRIPQKQPLLEGAGLCLLVHCVWLRPPFPGALCPPERLCWLGSALSLKGEVRPPLCASPLLGEAPLFLFSFPSSK